MTTPTRPGVSITTRATPPPRGAASDTGVWFVVGETAKGPVNEAIEVDSISDFVGVFGDRVSTSILYDAIETFYREGGVRAYVSRVVGPGAAVDTATLADAAATPSIAVDSNGPGDTDLTVSVVAGETAGTFRLVIANATRELERSHDLADVAAAVLWGDASAYVRVRALGVDNPAPVGPTALAGGSDDRAGITDTERVDALERFYRDLGPGQVSVPGGTTTTIHSALLEHAERTNRTAILDAPVAADRDGLLSAVAALRAVSLTPERGALFAPWVTVPGTVRGTTRTVPPSAAVAGRIARSDVAESVNRPAAGENGDLRFALGLSAADFRDDDRSVLTSAGVNTIRNVRGSVRVYGWRSLAPEDSQWVNLGAVRTRMAIEAHAERIAERFLFEQLDGQGLVLAEFGGALAGMLTGFYTAGALYGATPDEAFAVEVGPTVNTPETQAANDLRAVLSVRTSPFAEFVFIEIVKIPITEVL